MMLIWQPLVAQSSSLTERKIPWGIGEEQYLHFENFKTPLTNGKAHSYEAKQLTTINGIDFINTLNFIDQKGLTQISYIAPLKAEPFQDKCTAIKTAISDIYGQHTNEVNVTDQDVNNYSEIIWTSKVDRIVRVFCYSLEKNNYIAISIYPRWMILDCTMHNADESNKKIKNKRAFFYFDKENEDIRYFNNYDVTLPFNSTFKSQRIEFTHDNDNDRTTIDLNSGVIMSKFTDKDKKEQLLVGKCKIE